MKELDWIDIQHKAMVAQTIAWAEINSGSRNIEGLGRMCDALAQAFMPLGGMIERIELEPLQEVDLKGNLIQTPMGHALRIRKRPEAKIQVLLAGHMDTVYAEDHPFQQVKQVDANTINGPGVADLKGGLSVMLHALFALEQSEHANNIGWEVLINPDEEIGSISSRHLFKEAAKRNRIGLIFEPALAGGHIAAERKGSGNFTIVMKGKAAHAGRDFAAGRNAVVALAEYTQKLHALNGKCEGVTINPGIVAGGASPNMVPETAVLRLNVRVTKLEDQAWFEEQLETIGKSFAGREGFSHRVYGEFTRPPKRIDAKHLRLYEAVADCAKKLGLEIERQATGGACDGNNLSHFGLPNVDSLGVRGGHIHSEQEFMSIDSLTERAELSALLLLRLAAGELKITEF